MNAAVFPDLFEAIMTDKGMFIRMFEDKPSAGSKQRCAENQVREGIDSGQLIGWIGKNKIIDFIQLGNYLKYIDPEHLHRFHFQGGQRFPDKTY